MKQNKFKDLASIVLWMQEQDEFDSFLRGCYLDNPEEDAARRFVESAEWSCVLKLLDGMKGKVLDIGAGRGISSYAFAQLGWVTHALEPDSSEVVGAEAIRRLNRITGTSIVVDEGEGGTLPYNDQSFQVVYCRQVLHHVSDLDVFMAEVFRVLKPSGLFIAVKEHVVNSEKDLEIFLQNHVTHNLGYKESAYPLNDYIGAIESSGLKLRQVWGPYDSMLNYDPVGYGDRRNSCAQLLRRYLGYKLSQLITSQNHILGRFLVDKLAGIASGHCSVPGRLYSFLALRD